MFKPDLAKPWTAQRIEAVLPSILPRVQKPSRYIGGERNQVRKEWDGIKTRVAFAFPDIYDLGMPNTGLAILYDIINQRDDMLAERAYLPWTDMEAEMRALKMPLYSLETKHPLLAFDVIGVSLPYESVYTNLLSMLDLSGIPIFTKDRRRNDPIIVGGGHATFNPEPAYAFVDAFVIGEGEEAIVDIAEAVTEWKQGSEDRITLMHRLAQIDGVYVPSLYESTYDNGTLVETAPIDSELAKTFPVPAVVRKRIVAVMPPPLTRFIVPNLETVHNRISVEVMRGCTRGCRFCHAGMVTRPVRQRPVDEVMKALAIGLKETGFTEVGLLSLSSSDYVHVLPLVKRVAKDFEGKHLNISLPSLRIESFSVELMDALAGNSRRGGFTLAPEAASERMRRIINKPVSSEQLRQTAREIYQRGWHTIKLYFMIGHPAETVDDVQEIINLCKQVLDIGREEMGNRAQVNVGVSTFVPKPHTPFQWSPCDSREQIVEKQALLRSQIKGTGLKLNWNNPDDTLLEALLSRGDRRLAQVIYRAWKKGAKFDAWQEHFKLEYWEEALTEEGLSLSEYTHRERTEAEVHPWDHIDCAVNKSFLWEDYQWSQEEKTRVDCRTKCFACGILPKFKETRRNNPGDHWECPDVGKAKLKIAAQDQANASPINEPHPIA